LGEREPGKGGGGARGNDSLHRGEGVTGKFGTREQNLGILSPTRRAGKLGLKALLKQRRWLGRQVLHPDGWGL